MRWNRFGKKSDTIEATVVRDRAGRPALVVAADVRERVAPMLADARVKVAPLVVDARERGGAYVGQAKDWAAPRLDDAKLRAAPVVAGAVATVVPKIEHALEDASHRIVAALESTSPARDEVARRSAAAVAALKGEIDAPKATSHWGRRLMVMGLFAGVGAAVFAFFRRSTEDDSWITAESTYPSTNGAASSATSTSTGTSTNTSAAAAMGGPASHDIEGTKAGEVAGGTYEPADDLTAAVLTDDPAGAGFDEAAADATDEPKAPTTPDEPAERTTLEDS